VALLAYGAISAGSVRAEYRAFQEKEKPKDVQGASDRTKARPTAENTAKPGDAGVDPDSYKIGIEDELQISVWREPELSQPVQVRPDGMITLPLVNDLPVVGMTTKELQNALTEKLKPFVNEPQVTVIVRNIKSRKVYLVGQVMRPGPYALNGRKTVLQLIVEAGGLGQFAKSGSIYVTRTVNGQLTRMKFNYKKALSGKTDSGDVELLPGDMVVVP
jgi:polysaccharide export outer membrane protein